MPKINHEEYEVLKELDDTWKWIARDEAQQTYMYEYRPIKSKLRGRWESNWNDYYPLPHDWLQFIQWEDESPYNIAELIKEYESEETEVKKDKKWFVDKWTKERKKTDVHDPMYHFINEFIADVDQLDEPEVLSQDWIDEHLFFPNETIGEDVVVKARDLRLLIQPLGIPQELTSTPEMDIELYKKQLKDKLHGLGSITTTVRNKTMTLVDRKDVEAIIDSLGEPKTYKTISDENLLNAETVNSPSHYQIGGIETIDIMKNLLSEEEFKGYLKGNIIKYRERAHFKGKPEEDYAKAKWYYDKYKELQQ